jgi:hypothetical protein
MARNTQENPREQLGLWDAVLACSRLFPARGKRKWTAGKMVRSFSRDHKRGRRPCCEESVVTRPPQDEAPTIDLAVS